MTNSGPRGPSHTVTTSETNKPKERESNFTIGYTPTPPPPTPHSQLLTHFLPELHQVMSFKERFQILVKLLCFQIRKSVMTRLCHF